MQNQCTVLWLPLSVQETVLNFDVSVSFGFVRRVVDVFRRFGGAYCLCLQGD